MDLPNEDGFQKEVDTVRALHQTVVSLRAALEQSRLEIEELKERVWSSETCEIVLQNLSVENHVLRQRIIDVNDLKENTTQTSLPYITTTPEISVNDTNNNDNPQIIVTDIQAVKPEEIVQSIKSTRFNLNYEKAQENLEQIHDTKLLINDSEEELLLKTDNKTSKTSPRSIVIKLPVNTEENSSSSPKKSKKKIRTTEKENIEELPLNTDNKTSKTPPRSIVTKLPVNTEEYSSSSPKKSKKKIRAAENKPRQTIVTVNVTLKSPKRNKVNNKITMEEENPNQREVETSKGMDDNEGEEVDDIELIFTTDDTTTSVIKEELVSIADGDGEDCDTPVLLNYRTVDFDTPDLRLSCENLDKEIDDDDVFHENETTDNFENENTENLNFQINNSAGQNIHNSKSDSSINRDDSSTLHTTENDSSHKDKCYSYQDSSFESRSLDKDESFDKFDDKEKYLHRMWSNNSVLVETDISKCGIVDPEMSVSSARRNTCPNPVPYRPIMHREALAKHNPRSMGAKFNSRYEGALRPILSENQSPKTESEAQTDISALPSLWKSESYLAHKVAHQFTTLPSKFPIPNSQKSLRLSEKTKEARRVLLSDINFTSMVPELSRSADHLYQEGLEVMQTCGYGQYLNPPCPQLRRYNTGDSLTSPNFMNQSSQKFAWSPSDYSNLSSTKFDNSNSFLNRYRGSLSSINNQHSFDLSDFNVKRRSYSTSTANWKHNQPASFDNSRFMQSGMLYFRVALYNTRCKYEIF